MGGPVPPSESPMPVKQQAILDLRYAVSEHLECYKVFYLIGISTTVTG